MTSSVWVVELASRPIFGGDSESEYRMLIAALYFS